MNKITLLFNFPVVILDKYTLEFIDSGYHVGLSGTLYQFLNKKIYLYHTIYYIN